MGRVWSTSACSHKPMPFPLWDVDDYLVLIGKIPAGIIAQVGALGAEYSQDYRSLAIFPSLGKAVVCNGSPRWAHCRASLPSAPAPRYSLKGKDASSDRIS